MTQQNKIYVFEQFGDAPKLMGILNVDKVRGKETFSFEYNKNWLKTNSYPLLDPDIQHYNGIQYLQDENKPNFGIFLDSSPDRWGRELMQRREAIYARNENRKRIHVASAMTMLGYYDGYNENVSYLEIADFLTRHSVNPHKNLQELFRRIAFNISVSNCDDHLRNHSFIFDKKGISLSPAYDINPDEIGHGLSLNISLHDNSLDLEILMDTHEYYALQKDEALQIIEQVKGAVSGFDVVAKKTGLSKTEIDKKAVAFKQAMR